MVQFKGEPVLCIVKHVFKEIGHALRTIRLDCSHHHRRSCRLACRAVHEKPNGPRDEHRPWHRRGRSRELAVQPARRLARWWLARLFDCRLYRSMHPHLCRAGNPTGGVALPYLSPLKATDGLGKHDRIRLPAVIFSLLALGDNSASPLLALSGHLLLHCTCPL